VLLIVEDDATFARILLDVAHEWGFKGIISLRGDGVTEIAKQYNPHAITLDISLPDVGGWSVLDRLKNDPETRHIPVHVISVVDDWRKGLELGAITYYEKTISRETLDQVLAKIEQSLGSAKDVLIVHQDEAQRRRIVDAITGPDLALTEAASAAEALMLLAGRRFACVVVDLTLPEMSDFHFVRQLEDIAETRTLPVVVYTGRELSIEEEQHLRTIGESIIVRTVPSVDRLLDETALLLHRPESSLSEAQREIIRSLRTGDLGLAGRKVLIVDDDVRNIFALTSVLERHQMTVTHAENGRKGIEALSGTPDIDLVLMDIMMPEMDGYQTMHAIRRMPEFRNLPIIALTAKAMKGDREKCIAAGASDYITKPVDLDQLFSLLRVWMPRRRETVRRGV
jgi:CheY-like chemotaxis protein